MEDNSEYLKKRRGTMGNVANQGTPSRHPAFISQDPQDVIAEIAGRIFSTRLEIMDDAEPSPRLVNELVMSSASFASQIYAAAGYCAEPFVDEFQSEDDDEE